MRKYLLLLALVMAKGFCAPLPKGNYQKTCHNCRYDAPFLSCACEDEMGLSLTSVLSLKKPCANVKNVNGILKCFVTSALKAEVERYRASRTKVTYREEYLN